MTDPTPLPPSPDDPFQSSLGELATAVEERPPIAVEEAPQTRSGRQLYWLIGGLCALTIGAAEVGILLHSGAVDAPPPPAEVVALIAQDPCAARMVKIMDAVAAYTTQHGTPPKALTELHPGHLPFPPIDPVSSRPYGYELIGESVSLSCPSADLPEPIAAAGGPGR